jgi:hypothetical protein
MLIRLALMTTIFIAAPALAQAPASPSGSAQQPPSVAAVIDTCQADLKTVCGSEPFQVDRLTQCVRQNRAKLSPACQALWPEATQAGSDDVRSATRAMGRACATDIQSHCAGTGGQARRRCLSKNSDALSDACRTALSDLNRARQARRAGANQPQHDED